MSPEKISAPLRLGAATHAPRFLDGDRRDAPADGATALVQAARSNEDKFAAVARRIGYLRRNTQSIAQPGAEARNARRRVLMTADTVTGVWQYALELARALIARGDEVVVATMGRLPDRAQRREAAAIAGLELRARACKLLWMDEPWEDVRAAGEWLLGLAASLRPSVIHLNDFGHGHLPWPAPVVTVGHSCVTSWWRAVHGAPLPPPWLRYRRRVAESLRAADLVVAPSHAMLGALRRHYGPLRAARVIANGRAAVAESSAAKGKFIFCASRADDVAKNVGALRQVAPRLSWPVCLAGGERQRPARDNVRSLGGIGGGQVSRWLARAPVYALPARYEPSGLPVLEAALAGCALVLGDIDSLRENWDGAAVFVAPDDHEALAHALQRLIDDDALRARQAALARQRAQRFTPGAMAEAYACAYQYAEDLG